jgi:hypothetical protein
MFQNQKLIKKKKAEVVGAVVVVVVVADSFDNITTIDNTGRRRVRVHCFMLFFFN